MDKAKGLTIFDSLLAQLGNVKKKPHSAIEGNPAGGYVPKDANASVMTAERVSKAISTLKRYMGGKDAHDLRQVENERWWQLHSWEVTGHSSNPGDPEPSSAYTVNAIFNKHADAMDNYPKPTIRPRELTDQRAADILSEIMPVVLKRNDYAEIYSKLWWQKLKYGTGITGVFWDSDKDNGVGDISIRCVDALNLAWEPGITDIQNSRDLFYVETADIETVKEMYPDKADEIMHAMQSVMPKKYNAESSEDETRKCLLIDWYYKKYIGKKSTVHLCKLAGETVLYCSEDDPQYALQGIYDHGMFPFVFDVMFPMENSPCGSGYIDLCKPVQRFIDRLDQRIEKYCLIAAKPRFFKRQDCLVNLSQYADTDNDFVEYSGSGDPRESLQQIEIAPLPSIYAEIRNLKVEELKEIAGNRDFNQGSVSSGVTAASAITALQESGNKLSRDFIATSRRAYERMVLMAIELIRQFYTEERTFRITNKNIQQEQFVSFGSAQIAPRHVNVGGTIREYMPIFDVDVGSEKNSPFSTVAQNERAIQMYQMGMFDPARADQAVAAISLMDFEGKDETVERVRQGRTMYEVLRSVQQLTPTIMQMAGALDAMQGSDITNRLGSALQSLGFQVPMPQQMDYKTQSIQQTNAQNGSQKPTSPSDTPKSATTASDARFKTARAVSDV